ncbi:MAG: DUF3604 domain-containing protein [Candidatus Binatia bacterium]
MTLIVLAAGAAPAQLPPGPWQRTETRQRCAAFDIFRQPHFGDTHVHTAYSSDAVFAGTREDPRGAYRFAQGQAIGLPPYDAQGVPTRTAQLRRPLDFTAVTDHAEQFGEIAICLTPGLTGYDSPECISARTQLETPPPALPNLLPPPGVIGFLLGYGVLSPPQRFAWCEPDGSNCLAQASLIWQDTQAAAEEFYDRTAACTFTTFVAYEWSGQPGGNNLHRNVIFRNEVAPPLPISFMEEPTPQGLWNQLQMQCLDGLAGCDVLAIPHNPNVSGGLMFAPVNADGSPLTATDAAVRAAMEPVVEMNQHKGDSECRPGVQSTDEVCGFEKNNRLQLFNPVSDPNQTFPRLNYVRNALREGLVQDEILGVNPFRFGLIGSTDTHNSTPGATEERDFGAFGHLGSRDHANPAYMVARVTPAGIEGNAGGLAVVWAEENSRDALFAAIRRREVYGTSGSRPILRFFGGRESNLRCGDPDFVATAYAGGVPMGGEIGPVRGSRSPRFGVLAFRDPGTATLPGTQLQRVQIVKGWVDGSGQSQEKVFDVAGDASNGASVDPSCAPTGPGSDSLCAVWTDPEFDPAQRAFYYARVLENPTCRWSTLHCAAQGIDCSVPAAVPAGFAECCNPAVPKTIQERAWSAPIWYRPEAVWRVRGKMRFGSQPQSDVLDLTVRLGAMPDGFSPATQPLTLTLSDDDDIYRVTVPAGTLQETAPGRFAWRDRSGSIGGIRSLRLQASSGGSAVLRLRTAPLSLAAADRADHFATLSIEAGPTALSTTRLWQMQGGNLLTKD